MPKLYLIGLNHKTATVEVREKFALTTFTTPENWIFSRRQSLHRDSNLNCRHKIGTFKCITCGKYLKHENGGRCTAKSSWIKKQSLSNQNIEKMQDSAVQNNNTEINDLEAQQNSSKLAVLESLILSTCNRVEILVSYDADPDDLIKAWSNACGFELEDLKPYVYCYEGREAILHLFKVAASLDSLVLGEPQILGQLKVAYRLSVEAGQAGIMVNRALHRSFYAAKRVRNETAVASSAVSISYAAVELAKRIFEDMSKHEALLLGAGEMAELAAMHLMNNHIAKLRIVNRTFANAEELVSRIGGEAYSFNSLRDCLLMADIVISSTGAQEAIIDAKLMQEVMKERKNRSMFFIDIAMPRDIDPEVNNLDNVYVYDIDDLKEVIEENLAQRKDEALKAAEIIEEESHSFEQWKNSLTLKPTILEIEERGRAIVDMEVEKAIKSLKKIGIQGEELEIALEKMANSIVRKCHHTPLHFLNVSYKHNPTENAILRVRQVMGLNE